MAGPIHRDVDMIALMETDLQEKAQAAFADTSIRTKIWGVFSLDDLETKMESDIQSNGIAIGCAYHRALALESPDRSTRPASPGQSGAVKPVQFEFLIVLAVPTGEHCQERYNATELLTRLRMTIHGSQVAQDASRRVWNFMSEQPDVSASTSTVLYYSQVWQVPLFVENTANQQTF